MPNEKKKRPGGRSKLFKTLLFLLIALGAAAAFWLRWQLRAPAKERTPDAAASSAASSESLPAASAAFPAAPASAPASAAGGGAQTEWSLLIVSASAPLDRAFTVDLETVNGWRVDTRVAEDLRAMLAAAAADEVELTVRSAYRSVSAQRTLYEQDVKRLMGQGLSEAQAREKTGRTIQPPGCSEHHAGLALDIAAPYHQTLDAAFAQTAAFQWLREHGAQYGFVLRYPKGKEDVTGIDYEPWHFRYVGAAHALAMEEAGQCLEEYAAGLG